MTVLDSNVWIAFFHSNDTQHQKAKSFFRILKPPLLLPEYIMMEVVTVLAQRAGKDVANLFIERTLENRDVEFLPADDEFFLASLNLFRNIPSYRLSFVDVALLHLSNSHQVMTFDRVLDRSIRKQQKR